VEDQKTATIVVKTGLNKFDLDDFITEAAITHEQIITITANERGVYTLIFNGTTEQYAAYRAELDEQRKPLAGVLARSLSQTRSVRRGYNPQSYTMGKRR